MAKQIDYVTLVEAMTLHRVLINKYGGSDGVRDVGALESALFRPQSGYYADVIEEAAALFESLAINHPFIDGNKRVAFAVTDTFLRINGYQFSISGKQILKKMISLLEAGDFKFHSLEPWIRENVREVDTK